MSYLSDKWEDVKDVIKDPIGSVAGIVKDVVWDPARDLSSSALEELGRATGVSGFGANSLNPMLRDWLLGEDEQDEYTPPDWIENAPKYATLQTEPGMGALQHLPSFLQAEGMSGYGPDSGNYIREPNAAAEGGYAALPETYAALPTKYADNPGTEFMQGDGSGGWDYNSNRNRGVDYDRDAMFGIIESPEYQFMEEFGGDTKIGGTRDFRTPDTEQSGEFDFGRSGAQPDRNRNYTLRVWNQMVETFWGQYDEDDMSDEQVAVVGGEWPPYIYESELGL